MDRCYARVSDYAQSEPPSEHLVFSMIGIQARKVGAFPPIAFQTGKGKVFDDRPPAVLEWDYMIDLMREGSVIVVQPTVLAPV